MQEWIKENKYLVIGVVVAIVLGLALVSMILKDSTGVATVSDNAKLDQSKDIKSNVGDKTIGGDALEGINTGGGAFNYSKDTVQEKKN